jgi:glycosyltransferase involved in cell wall biosynthesis
VCNRYDFVHAHEEAVFFCRFLKPVFGFKLVYDMHSSLPQQLTNFQFTTSKALIGLFKRLEDSCLRKADAIITICPDLADYVDSLIQDKEKLFLIENSIFDPVRLLPGSADEEGGSGLAEPKPVALPENRALVVYAGTLEPYQGIDILIRAFRGVADKRPEAVLLIVGGTRTQVQNYADFAESCGLGPQCIFTGRVDQAMAKHYTGLASVLVSPRSEGTNTPLKIYEQLASGIPVVATNLHSHTQVLHEDVAFLVEPEPKDMARGILKALGSKDDRRRVTENAQRLYDMKYSRRVYENKMKKLLKHLSDHQS